MNGPFGLSGLGPVQRYEQREARGWLSRGDIDGAVLSNDTTDATNDFAIAAGVARSTVAIVDGTPSTLIRDQVDLELPVSIIKQADVAFSPDNYDPSGYSGGGRSGGRTSSALGNSTWFPYLVGGRGLQTDVILHDSATQSSVLAEMQKLGGYTAARRIGALLRESGALVAFTQTGEYFAITTPTMEVDASISTSSASHVLRVPLGIIVLAKFNIMVNNGARSHFLVSELTQTAAAASSTAAPLGTATSDGDHMVHGPIERFTNTSGQIRSYSSVATSTFRTSTMGWWDSRGRDS